MSLSILIFPDTHEIRIPYASSRHLTEAPNLTGKICVISSRPFECQSIELELRGDLMVDHQTSFDVLNNLIEGMPPPIAHIHHEVELPTNKFEIGHTIVEFSMPLTKKLPPSYEGLFVFIQYTLTAKMKYRKWMTSASIKSSSCNLKFITTTSRDSFPLKNHECSIPDKISTQVTMPSVAVAGDDKVPIQMVIRNGTPVGQSIKVQIWQIEKSSSFVYGPKRKYRLQYETQTSLPSLQNIFYLRIPSNLTSAFKVESNAAKAEVYHIVKFIIECTDIGAPVCVDVPLKIIGICTPHENNDDQSNHDRLPVYQERDETLPTYEWCSNEEAFTNPQITSFS